MRLPSLSFVQASIIRILWIAQSCEKIANRSVIIKLNEDHFGFSPSSGCFGVNVSRYGLCLVEFKNGGQAAGCKGCLTLLILFTLLYMKTPKRSERHAGPTGVRIHQIGVQNYGLISNRL